MREFYNVIESEYIKICKKPVITEKVKVELLDNADNAIGAITTSISSTEGNINIKYSQGVRRTCSLSVCDYNKSLIPSNEFSRFFINKKFKVYVGLYDENNEFYKDDIVYWFSQGIFIVTSCSYEAQNRILKLSGIDKFGLFTKDLNQHNLQSTYCIKTGSKLGDVIADTITIGMGNGEPTDFKTPIINTNLYNQEIPYDIQKTANETIGDILIEIATAFNADIYYNTEGNLVFEPNIIDDYKRQAPVFELYDGEVSDFSENYDYGNIVNQITVMGNNSSGKVYSYTAKNEYPMSSLRISNIGVKAGDIEETAMGYSEKRCQDYAEYLLNKKTIVAKSSKISITPLPHIDVNRIIRYYENDDYIIDEVNIPLNPDVYSINVCNINELPLNVHLDNINNTVEQIKVFKPYIINNNMVYNGTNQYISLYGLNPDAYTVTGTYYAKDSGNYSITIKLKSGYIWDDNTSNDLILNWAIEKCEIDTPILYFTDTNSSKITYTGSQYTINATGFDWSIMEPSGTYTASDAGTYYISFTLYDTVNYKWKESSEDSIITHWEITKASSIITVSEDFIPIKRNSEPKTIEVNYTGDGSISVISDNANVATVAIDGNNIIINDTGNGIANITISASEGANYLAPQPKIIQCVVNETGLAVKSFSTCTDEEIVSIIQAHYDNQINIGDYWSVGDRRTIHINAISATSNVVTAQEEQDIQIRIIGIEHDDLYQSINGHTKAAVTVECVNSLKSPCYYWGKSYYPVDDRVSWNGSPLWHWLRSNFKNAIPEAIGDIIKTVKKPTKLYHSVDASDTIVPITDTVFLLSVYEVYKDTDTNYSNTTDKAVEGKQYVFYETVGNRTATDYFNGTTNRAYRWLRSPAKYYSDSYGYAWCRVYTDNMAHTLWGGGTAGLCPAWCM